MSQKERWMARARVAMVPMVATAALSLALGLGLAATRGRNHHRRAAAGTAPEATCITSDLAIQRFPLDGIAGRDWMINSYVDLDPASPGIADYRHNRGDRARTYDGHQGIDIDVPSFRQMDGDLAVIHSVTAGTVDQIIQDEPDRHTGCSGRWNLVRVVHVNGFHVIYGHIKRGSARVVVGQAVAVGAPLAIVGSSGCSTQPHLHLEVRDCANLAVDPFLPAPGRPAGLWADPPAYDAPSDVMDVMLRPGAAPTLAQIKDPAPDPAAIAADRPLGVGLSLAVRGGDVLEVSLIKPSPSPPTSVTVTVGGTARLSHRYASLAFPVAAMTGRTGNRAGWAVQVRINGVLRATRAMKQEAPRKSAARSR